MSLSERKRERERVIARLVLANSCVICACKSACVSVCECAQCRVLVFITRAKNFFLFFSPKTHSQQSPHSFKPTFTTFQFSVGVCKEQKSQIRRKTILPVTQVIPKWIYFLATPLLEEVIIFFFTFPLQVIFQTPSPTPTSTLAFATIRKLKSFLATSRDEKIRMILFRTYLFQEVLLLRQALIFPPREAQNRSYRWYIKHSGRRRSRCDY